MRGGAVSGVERRPGCRGGAVSGVECRPGCRDMPLYAAICRPLERKWWRLLRFVFSSQAEGRGFEPRFPLQFHSKIFARLILKRSPDLSFARGSDEVTKRSRCDVNVRVGGTKSVHQSGTMKDRIIRSQWKLKVWEYSKIPL